MVKNKNRTTKKPVASTHKKPKAKIVKPADPIDDTPDYDSMIENGTSEEDSETESNNEEQEESSVSDDGFSEHEESDEQQQHQQATTKRKLPATTNKDKVGAPSKKKKDNEKSENGKLPTREELVELKETRNLYHSNLFRLQIKEMITELKIKDKYTNHINKWLKTFTTFLQGLKNMPTAQSDTELDWLDKRQVKVPLTLEGIQVPRTFQFQFIKPTSSPMLIGAASNQTLLGPQLVADVCVLMPAAYFQKDNYLNLVYDQKRAFYLTYLVYKMRESKDFTDDKFAFNYHANNPLKPVLELTSKNSKLSKLCIRLHIAAESDSFKLSRFVPWNSNIRPTIYGDEVAEDASPLATPHYNASVLHDLTMQSNQELIMETFNDKKNFQEGLLLLKVWLRQRQLNVGYYGFNAYIFAMYIVYLYKQRKLNANMSSYQVARNVWNQFANSTWDQIDKGITLCLKSEAARNKPSLSQFHDSYEVVFVDVTGFYNICANLPREMYERVRQEAKLAVDMLNDMKLNSFQCLFMSSIPIYTQFDHVLKLNKPDAIEQLLELHVKPADKYDTANYAQPQLFKIIKGLLHKGLAKRLNSLLPIEQLTHSWSIETNAPICNRYLHLGIVLNPEHAFEVLERGPETIAPEANEFRKFWGDKAQLRRFQDGSIVESVVWGTSTDPLAKKRLVIRSIILHLLQHHFQLDDQDVEYLGGEFDIVYKLTPAFKTESVSKNVKIPQETDAEAMIPLVVHCFDELVRQLHDLRELPVEIVGISGISTIFKYCEPEPVLPEARIINNNLFATHVHRAVIQLGVVGNWPNELGAMRALKTAFYIQIAQMIRDKYKLYCKVTYDGLLIFKKGYCFGVELAHPKEVTLLKKEKVGIITKYEHCPESIALEKRFYVLPKMVNGLHSLYQTNPCFGSTVMIAKRWLGTQLIDSGLWPDEATELLIANLFLRAHIQQATTAPQTGFIRFLHLLAHTDWKSEFFLVNFNNEMDENQISDLENRFRTERDTFPPLTIATSYDLEHHGKLWTKSDCPNVNVIARVTVLARQALDIIETSLLSTTEKFIKPARLFKASHLGYDLVIQIKPDQVRNVLCYDFGSPFAALTRPNWKLPLAGTNFLQDAVQKLREAYCDYAAFFYNAYGGKEIGIVWKPDEFFAPKDFKVNEVNGCTLSLEHPNKVQCFKETLIEDFKFILKDYYLRIDTVETVLRESRDLTKRYYEQQSQSHEKKLKTLDEDFKQTPTNNSNGELKIINKVKVQQKSKSSKSGKIQKSFKLANNLKSKKLKLTSKEIT